MGFKKNNPGCNCCADCSICSDDFARSDGSDISTGSACGWTKDSGTWELSGGVLFCSSAGVVKCNTVHPDSVSTMDVSVSFKHNTSGSFLDVIVGYVDSTHYFYARYKINGGTGSIDIRKNNGGTHTSLKLLSSVTMNTATYYAARVCVNPSGHISASLDGTVKVTALATGITGTYCGLGCSGSGSAHYDGFVFKKAYQTSATACPKCTLKDPTCPTALACDLEITMTGWGAGTPSDCGDCAATLDATFTIPMSENVLDPGAPCTPDISCGWRQLEVPGCTAIGLTTYLLEAFFRTGSDGISRLHLYIQANGVLVNSMAFFCSTTAVSSTTFDCATTYTLTRTDATRDSPGCAFGGNNLCNSSGVTITATGA